MDKLLELPREDLIRIARGLSIAGRSRMSNRELAEAIYRLSLEVGVSSFFLHRSDDSHLRVEYNNIYLPMEIGRNRACLLYRDPLWAYVYWEMTRDILPDGDSYSFTLKIMDNHTRQEHVQIGEVERVGRWYLNLNAPEREFYAVVGVTFTNGDFLELVRSNIIKMPAVGFSDDAEQVVFYNRKTGSRQVVDSDGASVGVGAELGFYHDSSIAIHRRFPGSSMNFSSRAEDDGSEHGNQ